MFPAVVRLCHHCSVSARLHVPHFSRDYSIASSSVTSASSAWMLSCSCKTAPVGGLGVSIRTGSTSKKWFRFLLPHLLPSCWTFLLGGRAGAAAAHAAACGAQPRCAAASSGPGAAIGTACRPRRPACPGTLSAPVPNRTSGPFFVLAVRTPGHLEKQMQ